MAELIAKAQTGTAEEYSNALRGIAVMQDDLVYPDISVAARNAWVSHSARVASAKPDPTLSRTFFTGVTLK